MHKLMFLYETPHLLFTHTAASYDSYINSLFSFVTGWGLRVIQYNNNLLLFSLGWYANWLFAPIDLFQVRDPMPAVYFFLIDVSMNAIQTGATAAACSAISQVISDLPVS